MVSGLKGESYEERCAELGLETLETRRQRQDMTMVHKFLREENQRENGRARTRQAAGEKNVRGQIARTDMRKHSFAVRTVESWNSLPDNTKQAVSTETFRNLLKKK
jgi:hypothetical protein